MCHIYTQSLDSILNNGNIAGSFGSVSKGNIFLLLVLILKQNLKNLLHKKYFFFFRALDHLAIETIYIYEMPIMCFPVTVACLAKERILVIKDTFFF